VPDAIEEIRPVFLALLGEKAIKFGLDWVTSLRQRGIYTEIDYRLGSLKSQLNRANSLHAILALIIGENEIKESKALLRHMDTKEQIKVSIQPQEGLSELLKLLRR